MTGAASEDGHRGELPHAEVPPSGAGTEPYRPSPKLIEALVCPASGGTLEWNRETDELISRAAGLAYPIRSGIPIMLISEARPLES